MYLLYTAPPSCTGGINAYIWYIASTPGGPEHTSRYAEERGLDLFTLNE